MAIVSARYAGVYKSQHVNHFPNAVLEIKLRGAAAEQPPEWVSKLSAGMCGGWVICFCSF